MGKTLLPRKIPVFLDNRFVKKKGAVRLDSVTFSVIYGMVSLEERQFRFRMASPFIRNQPFYLMLMDLSGRHFDQISLPLGSEWIPKKSITLSLSKILLRAFNLQYQFLEGFEARCRLISEEMKGESVEVKIIVRQWLLAKLPNLLL